MAGTKDVFVFLVVIGSCLTFGIFLYTRYVPYSMPTIKDAGIQLSDAITKEETTCPPPLGVNLSLASKLSGYTPLSYHTNYSRNTFTIVMPTYGRSAQLPQILTHYCGISNVAKILVLWNNIGVQVPGPIKDFKCQVPLKIKIMEENKLTSRFVPYPEIETEAIYAVDDDRMVDPVGMEKGFEAWKAFPHLIVGFCERSHSFKNGRYKYSGGKSYSMILTNSVFLHRMYLKMFTESLPHSIHAFIDKNMNGEDIAMNAMVADYLKKLDRPQCPCVKVKGSTKEIHMKPTKPGQYVSLYHRGNHMKKRDECLNLIANEYKYMPLIPCKFVIT
ncbi:PREDICTED: exostosin-like 2 [Amphimedon queenslandica]|uniref:Glycosyl transferase 64 domain-containing protein n=1 Tax=Amphimedon queenslandica TaxID=400682 RepID=A0A1X7VML6_AMPQE|nr:PREDICTED: exostosin-like 2 [Amphimedon queenslandica]|eukprot:XP_003383404.1 PREDICTED: exostosin-like 2 [Amphimedon queenslandica]